MIKELDDQRQFKLSLMYRPRPCHHQLSLGYFQWLTLSMHWFPSDESLWILGTLWFWTLYGYHCASQVVTTVEPSRFDDVLSSLLHGNMARGPARRRLANLGFQTLVTAALTTCCSCAVIVLSSNVTRHSGGNLDFLVTLGSFGTSIGFCVERLTLPNVAWCILMSRWFLSQKALQTPAWSSGSKSRHLL